MSSDAKILSSRARASGADARPVDPRRWAALVVMLPARRRHNTGMAAVTEYGRQTSSIRGESS